jgi:hypothetical protein
MRLYVEGGTAGELGKVAFDRAEILKVLRAGGEIDCGQALQLRICRVANLAGSEEERGVLRREPSRSTPVLRTARHYFLKTGLTEAGCGEEAPASLDPTLIPPLNRHS